MLRAMLDRAVGPHHGDIRRALSLFRRADAALILLLALLAALFIVPA